jgi:hypothetical protein
MGLRFRRSIRLAPGLRLNFSGSGASVSAGPRGFSTTFGSRGTFLNAGIPGTGLYTRSRIGSSSRGTPVSPSRDPTNPSTISVSAAITVKDDGTVEFKDLDGNPLPDEWIARAKRQKGDQIRELIVKACNQMNEKVEALGTIHVHTPPPHERLRYEAGRFDVPKPMQPEAKPHGFLGWLFKSVRERIDAENAEKEADYIAALDEWQAAKKVFEKVETERRLLLEERVFSDVGAMEEVLEGALQAISWPRETVVSAEVDEGGRLVLLDVDLPEIEDLPKTTASVPSRGYKMTIREIGPTKLQKLYMQHVHGVGFRIIGEAFAVLPKADEIILSAYSQRANKATGAVTDEYLYSVRVKRSDWSAIRFDNLVGLDVITALERFELQRDMSKTGIFRPVEPLSAML